MMVSPTTQKIVITLIVLILLGFFGYRVFLSSAEAPVDPADLSASVIIGQDILDLVEKVEAITIDQSIFTSSLFTNLIDFNITLLPEPQGRPNPFAEIGSDSSFVGTVSPGGNR